MERAVPWAALMLVAEPCYPKTKTGRPPYRIETMLRIHYRQWQWFALSDPTMEESLHDRPVFRVFAKLARGVALLHDETTTVRFRYLPTKHDLATDMLRAVNDILQARA